MPIPSSTDNNNHNNNNNDNNNDNANECNKSSKYIISTPSSPSSPQTYNQQDVTTQKKKPIQRSLLGQDKEQQDAVYNLSNNRIRNAHFGSLYAGSRFVGSQKCGDNCYDVVVEIQNVNLEESTLNGYLNIKGLTPDFPELTTYFEGEIIGPKYSFLTRKWQAQHYIDVAHWKRFPSFQPFVSTFNQDDFVYDPTNEDFVYMRWKEKFLVPDHHINHINGASYDGFYYICFQRSTNTIDGMYFYRQYTPLYQELSLQYVPQRSFGSYEFR